MQVIKGRTVVKLSMQELEDAVRRYVDSKEGLWIDEMEIEIDGYEIVESEKLERDAKVNLIFRTGRKDYDRDAAHLDFSQTGDSHDIIWYQLC